MTVKQHDILPETCKHQYSNALPSPLIWTLYEENSLTTNEACWEDLEEDLFDFLSIYLIRIHVFIHSVVCLFLAQRNWR